jgi:hypothetical protein
MVGVYRKYIVEFAAQVGRNARIRPTRGNGYVELAAFHSRGHDESALLRRIGDVGEDTFAFGRYADAMVHHAVVRGGEHEHVAPEIGRAKAAADEAHGQIFEIGQPFGRYHRHTGAGVEQSPRLPKRHLPRPDHEHGAVLQVEKYGVVFH